MDKNINSSVKIYNICQSLVHHKNSARTIGVNCNGLLVSGSFDKTCAFWGRNENNKYEFIRESKLHDDYIYVVRPSINNQGFFTGSKDKKTIYMDNEGNPLMEYEGHMGIVNSISQAEPNIVGTGSWDATAKIWDVETAKVLYTLPDHAYAVTILALGNGRYITGSQDKRLRFWDNNKCFRNVDNAHNDIIRDIILSHDGKYIYTCSNDYSVKKWTLTGDELDALVGHEGFVFTCAENDKYLYSGGDDKIVNIWKNDKVDQSILHPNTVWDMALYNNELITSCADGIIRVFSDEETKWAPQDEIETYQGLCVDSLKQPEGSNPNDGGEKMDVSKLPDLALIANYQGKEGEIRIFNDKGNAVAYVYKTEINGWEKIGDVLGNQSKKKYYPGDKAFAEGNYDFVFDVELEQGYSKLPFNEGDNCLVAAEKFIAREDLHKLYIDDVVKFLRVNGKPQVQGTAYKTTEKKPTKSNNLPEKKVPTIECQYNLPRIDQLSYDNINIEGPVKKIEEFNNIIKENENLKANAITDLELKNFKKFLDIVTKKQFYHSSTFPIEDYQFLTEKLGKWPKEYIVPLIDCYRMFLLHPRCHDFFKKPGAGISELTMFLELFKDGEDKLKILILRAINNFFIHEGPRVFISQQRQIVLDTVSTQIDSEVTLIREAISMLLYNYSVVYYEKEHNETSMQVIGLINEMIGPETDSGIALDLFIALGNMVFNNAKNYQIAKDMDVISNIKDIDQVEDEDFKDNEEIQQFMKYFYAIFK